MESGYENSEYVKSLEQKNKELVVKLEKSEQKNKILGKRLGEVLLDYKQFIECCKHLKYGLNKNKHENRKKTLEFIQRIERLEKTNSRLNVDLFNARKRKREEEPRPNYSNKKAKLPLLISSSKDFQMFNLMLTECLSVISDRQRILGEKHSELLKITPPEVHDLVCKNKIGSENMKTLTYALNNVVSSAMRLGGMHIAHNQIHGRTIENIRESDTPNSSTPNNSTQINSSSTQINSSTPLEKQDEEKSNHSSSKLKKPYEPDSWMSFYI